MTIDHGHAPEKYGPNTFQHHFGIKYMGQYIICFK
jgi:hypothetical protein